MTMEQIYNLKWEALVKYYDNSLSMLQEFYTLKRDLKRIEQELKYYESKDEMMSYFNSRLVILVLSFLLFVAIVSIPFIVVPPHIKDNFKNFRGGTVIILVLAAVSLLWFILTVAFISWYEYKTSLKNWMKSHNPICKFLARKKHEIQQEIDSRKKIREKKNKELEKILQSEDFLDMSLGLKSYIFKGEKTDINYVKALKSIVEGMRADTHHKAILLCEKDRKDNDQQILQKKSVAAQEKAAENARQIAISQRQIAKSQEEIVENTEKLRLAVKELKEKIGKNSENDDSESDLLDTADKIFSIANNLVSILNTLKII